MCYSESIFIQIKKNELKRKFGRLLSLSEEAESAALPLVVAVRTQRPLEELVRDSWSRAACCHTAVISAPEGPNTQTLIFFFFKYNISWTHTTHSSTYYDFISFCHCSNSVVFPFIFIFFRRDICVF